jgi:hypothetical protein
VAENTQALKYPRPLVETHDVRLAASRRIAALEFLGPLFDTNRIDEVDCVMGECPRSLPHGLTDQFLWSPIGESSPEARLLAIPDVIQTVA